MIFWEINLCRLLQFCFSEISFDVNPFAQQIGMHETYDVCSQENPVLFKYDVFFRSNFIGHKVQGMFVNQKIVLFVTNALPNFCPAA